MARRGLLHTLISSVFESLEYINLPGLLCSPLKIASVYQQVGWTHAANGQATLSSLVNPLDVRGLASSIFFRGVLPDILHKVLLVPDSSMDSFADRVAEWCRERGFGAVLVQFFVGMVGSLVLNVLAYPAEVVATILASDPKGLVYNGSFLEIFHQIRGPYCTGFFYGFYWLLLEYGISRVIMLELYSAYANFRENHRATKKDQAPTFSDNFAPLIASTLALTFVYPLKTLRSVQIVTGLNPQRAYEHTITNQGFGGFFNGIWLYMAIPLVARMLSNLLSKDFFAKKN